jgi:hypothetical protein
MNGFDYETGKTVKKSRLEAYFDVVKSKYGQLLVLGLLFVLAVLPVVTYRYLVVAYEIEMNAAVAEGGLSSADAFFKVRAYKNTFFLTALPLSMVIATVAAGAAKVIKSLVWKEPTPPKDNFSQGLRENLFPYAACFVFSVLLMWACSYVRYGNVGYSVWFYLPTVGWYLLALPVGAWYCASSAVYKERLFKTFGNSIKLYGRTLPQTLGMLVLATFPLTLTLIPVAWVQLAVPLLYAFFYLPFALVGFAFFANGVFDKYVNAESFPDLVDRGLW